MTWNLDGVLRIPSMARGCSHHDVSGTSSGSCLFFWPLSYSLSLILRVPNIVLVSLFLSLKISRVGFCGQQPNSLLIQKRYSFEHKDGKLPKLSQISGEFIV